jgi:hypothetical protein
MHIDNVVIFFGVSLFIMFVLMFTASCTTKHSDTNLDIPPFYKDSK